MDWLWYSVAMANPYSDSCVVCMNGGHEEPHDCAQHQITGYHEIDGTPTSEPCTGYPTCPDCVDVLNDQAEAMGITPTEALHRLHR